MRISKYTRFEILRTVRSRRYLIFSLAFPLVLFFTVAGPNRMPISMGSLSLSTT